MKSFTFIALALFGASSVAGSPLWDYVHSYDPTYSYFDTGVRYGGGSAGYTGYLLNMTSQTWLSDLESDRSVWTHQLLVVIPDNLKPGNTGFLYITGGGNGNPGAPSDSSEDVLFSTIMAVETGTICGTLWQIPNQPIVFPADPLQKQRSEDAAVAFTWWQYMNDPSRPDRILYFPMTKAAVRALDTIADFGGKHAGVSIDKFVVAGASKRGWITWLTGASDDRVIGIMPIVMDMLNFAKNVMHMYEAYGGWTFAFTDYYDMNITRDLPTDKINILSQIIDPLVYKENLTMPKLVIDSTGDEFFMPDDDHYWWGMLDGETYRLMISNAEHSMATGVFPLITGATAFYKSILLNAPRPSFNWTIEDGTGDIRVWSAQKPTQAVMRFATTIGGTRRDFRLIKGDTPHDPCNFIKVHIFGTACVNPVLWVGEDIKATEVNGGFEYVASQPLPPEGWRGFFVDMYYPGPANSTFRMTTQISIIPQKFPYKPCTTPEECYGYLV